uniref:Putative inactive protein RESTRICTED TEV MOVEMENT 1-like n=1 Tax=Davidia involucrata TaxID=16924 RepID=A0A5B7B841_DAVIN
MIKIGAISCDGEVWDDKGRSDIVQIFISWTDGTGFTSGINFIQFLYVENGTLVLSEKHGGKSGNKFNTVKLDYPSEFLTRLSGHVVYRDRGYDVDSITFGTNRGTHGPFGGSFEGTGEDDTFFDFQMGQDRPFGGFHGSTMNGYLQSIGVYVRPIATLSNLNNTTTEIKKEYDDDSMNSHLES